MNVPAKSIDWQEVKRRLHENQLALEKALNPDPERTAAVFRERALQLARRRLGPQVPAGTLQLLVVGIGGEEYGFELSAVIELFPFAQCTPVPGSPQSLLGVANVRGKIRSVVDLGRLLGLPEANGDARGYVLLVCHGAQQVGFKVGAIHRIQAAALEEIVFPADAAAGTPDRYVRGLTSQKVRVLSAEALCTHALFGRQSTQAGPS